MEDGVTGNGQLYPAELRERAIRLVAKSVREGSGEWDSIRSVAGKLGIMSPETVRIERWRGATSRDREQVADLLHTLRA